MEHIYGERIVYQIAEDLKTYWVHGTQNRIFETKAQNLFV